MKDIKLAVWLFVTAAPVLLFPAVLLGRPPEARDAETREIRILATSDLHGKFLPWDYVLGKEDRSGSAAQLATAVRERRDENTVLVDAGDILQGNGAEFFMGEEVHPMIQCLDAMGYDAWCPGNHDFNYGMSVLKEVIRSSRPEVIAGNVRDGENGLITEGSLILERNGIRIGLIGMVTPNCSRWDAVERNDYRITDPLEETRRIIDEILPDVDVLVGLYHMGIENEYGVPNSGVRDIAEACPEFDVIIASHNHRLVSEMIINGVLVAENKNRGQTMAEIILTLKQTEDGWTVAEREAGIIRAKDYDPDPEITRMMSRYDRRAKKEMKVLE